jgi:hypothetical protein
MRNKWGIENAGAFPSLERQVEPNEMDSWLNDGARFKTLIEDKNFLNQSKPLKFTKNGDIFLERKIFVL